MVISAQALKKTGLAAAGRVYSEIRQINSNNGARAVLAVIEAQQGRTDRKQIGLADAYAREVLGSEKYAPWLHVYTAVSGRFKDGWIPDNYYGLVVSAAKATDVAGVARVKSFTNRILNTKALPDIAYVVDGIYYSTEYRPVRPEHLPALLFADTDFVYFKEDGSAQGRSVSIMRPADFPAGGRPRLPDGVFQAPIRQHAFFRQLSPKSTATLRITTARELDGTVAVKAAYLRGGRAGDDIVTCRTHVRVPLDRETGALADWGYLHDWRRTDRHPDTGFRFAGNAVPNFRDVAVLCRTLHESCPHMLCLGWDTCINEAGEAQIMEWNSRHNDIKFSEATTGPCFLGLGWERLWRREEPARLGTATEVC